MGAMLSGNSESIKRLGGLDASIKSPRMQNHYNTLYIYVYIYICCFVHMPNIILQNVCGGIVALRLVVQACPVNRLLPDLKLCKLVRAVAA